MCLRPSCRGTRLCAGTHTAEFHHTAAARPSNPPIAALSNAALQDDADHQRELYASIVNQLLMTYLMSPAGK